MPSNKKKKGKKKNGKAPGAEPPAPPPSDSGPMLSDNVLAAHGTIAALTERTELSATFTIIRYLRYAQLQADGGPPQSTFSIPLKSADQQVATLAEEAEGVLTEVIASLNLRERVELDWIQIKLPGVQGELVNQCQNLGSLSTEKEDALRKQFPEPRLMGRKGASSVMGMPLEQNYNHNLARSTLGLASGNWHAVCHPCKETETEGTAQ
jgi:hypothetical protein